MSKVAMDTGIEVMVDGGCTRLGAMVRRRVREGGGGNEGGARRRRRRGQREHLRAKSDEEQVQEVHSRQGRVDATGSRGALNSTHTSFCQS